MIFLWPRPKLLPLRSNLGPSLDWLSITPFITLKMTKFRSIILIIDYSTTSYPNKSSIGTFF